MKFCYACGHTTGGEPLFCNSCGCSFNVKLCPKLHMTPRLAEACSQCGTRDLSTPQPRVPLHWQLLAFLTQFISGIFLALLTLPVPLELLKGLFSNFKIHHSPVILILLLAALWSIWSILPGLFRRVIYRSIKDSQGVRKSG